MPAQTPRTRGLFCAACGCAAALFGIVSFAAPAQAQGTGTGPTAPDGSFVITRDVPTRPAYEAGNGDATWVETSPDQAFASGLALGLAAIDDAQAAGITGGPALGQSYGSVLTPEATDHAIANTMNSSGLTGLHQQGGGSVGSIVGSSLDAGLAAAGAGIDSALGSIGGALGSLGGLGQ